MGGRGDPDVPSERGGIVFGTGIGGIETLLVQHNVLLEKGPGRVSPFMVPALMANAAAGHLAMKFGLTGPNYCTVSACASSNHAIGEGMGRSGRRLPRRVHHRGIRGRDAPAHRWPRSPR